MVTTGLKCAPLIGPNVRISATSPAPVAMVLASSAIATFPPASRSPMMPEPTTVASRNAVPTASLVAFLITIAPASLEPNMSIPCASARRMASAVCGQPTRNSQDCAIGAGSVERVHGDKASPFEKMRRRRRQQEKLTQLASLSRQIGRHRRAWFRALRGAPPTPRRRFAADPSSPYASSPAQPTSRPVRASDAKVIDRFGNAGFEQRALPEQGQHLCQVAMGGFRDFDGG